MKKFFVFLIVAIFIGGLVFAGLKFLDIYTYDYIGDTKKSLDKFYVSGSIKDLESPLQLLDDYYEDLEKIDNIQVFVADTFASWIDYVANKYLCNSLNANACKVQYEEFISLKEKLVLASNAKSSMDLKLLSDVSYRKLLTTIEDRSEVILEISNGSNATSPLSFFEDERNKCEKTSDCERCSDIGLCQCNYSAVTGEKEILMCLKPELARK